MIKSMTGFGRSEYMTDDLNVIVEIKTLNSKHLDSMVKIPKVFSEKEIEIRNLLEKHLERGKIILSIDYQNKGMTSQPQVINEQLFKMYYKKLQEIARELSDEKAEIFRLALYLPDVIAPEISNNEDLKFWSVVEERILDAIKLCDNFRIAEGNSLAKELVDFVEGIKKLLKHVDELDPERIKQIRKRINNNLKELIPDNEFDRNRFEQELIYYLEKIDITEEKARLKSHLDYFITELNSNASNGKKLNFIAQEMGREINTIGSKASYAPITRKVVLMKDNLEKIKEQLLNIL